MSTSIIAMDESDYHRDSTPSNEVKANIESYRNLVQQQINLRRYKSALFWAEKIVVLSDNNPKDIYNLAQCMFLLREYNRAAHVIRRHQLEKKNLLCLLLLVECLYSAREYQDALNLITLNDIEELGTSLMDNTTSEYDSFIGIEVEKNVSYINFTNSAQSSHSYLVFRTFSPLSTCSKPKFSNQWTNVSRPSTATFNRCKSQSIRPKRSMHSSSTKC